MAGLSLDGFERKRLPEIKTDIENALKQAFGENIDLRAESVFGQIVGVLSLPLAELWEEAENIYLAFDPDYAEGVSLDSLAALTGVTRIAATSTIAGAILYGINGTTIPAGAQVRNAQTTDVYSLSSAVTISAANLVQTRIVVASLQNLAAYTITIDGAEYSVTSSTDATANEIMAALALELDGIVLIDVDGDALVLTALDNQVSFSAALSANLGFAIYGSPGLFVADVPGARLLPIGVLTEIQTPVAGWASVNNIDAGVTGRNRESDPDLRVRRRESVSFPATATIDAIRSRLLQVTDLFDAIVRQNNGEFTDENGVPPQHIWTVVRGGADGDIADVLYRTTAGGIGFFGEEESEVLSESGQSYTIRFDRADEIGLYVDMTIIPNGDYPIDAEDQIKAAVTEWVAANIGIGDKLKYSRIYTPINSVPGFEVTELFIGITENPVGTESLDVGVAEILVADPSRINITVDNS